MTQELKLRIIFGILLAAVVLLVTWWGGVAFRAFAGLVGLLVAYEWLSMSAKRLARDRAASPARPEWLSQLPVWGMLAVSVVLTVSGWFVLALLWTLVAALSIYLVFRQDPQRVWLAGGVVYAGASLASIGAIREGGQAGLFAMLFVFAVVWATDIMAYFIGRTIGGPKLAPSISPGKTWSGAIGGAVCAVIAGVGLCLAYGGAASFGVAVLCVVMSAFSQAGDLFESAIKRRCGVKDSSHIIPGHGGVMDRVDGLVAAAVFLFVVTSIAGLFSPAGFQTVGDVLWHWSGLSAVSAVSGA